MKETGKEKAMEATATTLAKLIRTMRTAEGLKQSELAMEVYSDTSSICRWEHGENISWFKFLEIATALGYTVEIEVKGGAE
jgi:transcriptional regulator with XRE-family HTH domain